MHSVKLIRLLLINADVLASFSVFTPKLKGHLRSGSSPL